MSRRFVAPVSAIASSTIRSSSSSESGCRHELLEDRELGLFLRCLLFTPTATERLGRLDPPLALALEHLQLFVAGQRPLEILLGAAETVQDQAQGIAARCVTREHRVLHFAFELLDEAHMTSTAVSACCGHVGVGRAAEDVPVQMEDRLARARADVDLHPVVGQADLAGGVGDELEHALRLARRKLADLAEAVDVPLRNDQADAPRPAG